MVRYNKTLYTYRSYGAEEMGLRDEVLTPIVWFLTALTVQ